MSNHPTTQSRPVRFLSCLRRPDADVVLGGWAHQGELMRDALGNIPLTVEPWEALRQALHAVDALAVEPGVTLKIAKVMSGTPSLRARSIEKHLHWQSLLVPNIRRPLGGSPKMTQ